MTSRLYAHTPGSTGAPIETAADQATAVPPELLDEFMDRMGKSSPGAGLPGGLIDVINGVPGDEREPDHMGLLVYHTEDLKTTNLSKASLGRFVFTVIRNGGNILSSFCIAPDCPRAAVWWAIELPPSAVKTVEIETGVRLKAPPRVTVGMVGGDD